MDRRGFLASALAATTAGFLINPVRASVFLALQGAAEEWPFPLPAGYYTAAKWAPVISHPRPDAETETYAYCRKACDGIPWEIPISVSGGAWPFKFELLQGSSGMSVGEYLDAGPGVYGVLSWSNPTTVGSPHTVQVRITDQESNTATVTWTVSVVDPDGTPATTGVYFVDSGAGAGGAGTLSDPYDSISDLPAGNDIQCYLRGGSHDLPTNNGDYIWTTNPTYNGCGNFIGYPGESVTLDFQSDQLMAFAGTDDHCIVNIKCYNTGIGGVASGPTYFVWLTLGAARALFYKVTFDTIVDVDGGDSNYACIYCSKTDFDYIVISHCKFQNITPTGGLCNLINLYQSDYSVIEECEAVSVTVQTCFWLKGGDDYCSMRRLSALNSNSTMTVGLQLNGGSSPYGDYAECCWSRFYDVNPGDNSIRFPNNLTAAGQGPAWMYRCGIRAHISAFAAMPDGNDVEECAISNSQGTIDDGTTDDIQWTECSGSPDGTCNGIQDTDAATMHDTNCALTGSWRTSTWLGKIGWECTDGADRIYNTWQTGAD